MQSCFSVCCAWFQKKPKPNKTVKLTLYHRTEVLRARYTDVDPSNEPNRPHISSDIINVKEHTSRDNNQQMRQIPDAPADQNPINATVFPMRPTVSPARPSVSPPRFPPNPASPPSRPVCPRSASAPPVKGVLSPVTDGRNTKIIENGDFCCISKKSFIFKYLNITLRRESCLDQRKSRPIPHKNKAATGFRPESALFALTLIRVGIHQSPSCESMEGL
ncbi:hypothetical protein PhaeoP75_03335 [Phaeobacter gallaeciensis]|uniref:Uncharacterized protein n=1 Tax=Phaeobacter gallaeciensis TaxID=60890 RepID=A0AAD0EEH8_9RHOB|nr:hypothetical protein Gal_03299 [Phaeobacter gallaeciensis DSM 26640]ATE94282.1 hypothetical protein PhaeoP11_03286 [Phaeobacter gallaeciensis]ATE98555.1 hypothetical protein PhaeoP73_03284 [Phaeobacter gallaeciensis]ATF02946.1 hypothetical protein PhaeoP75_03335 [Phaeobacter gallaeciensis]ATF07326.1 hypothetical protein PhaeoP63_03284 [Phaeobacter gallaeciensis]